MIITTIRDLSTWVSDRLGSEGNAKMAEEVTARIRNAKDCPAFGSDWSEFLGNQDVLEIAKELPQVQFAVSWQIDIYASSPEEAARIALKIQRDPTSQATVFEVFSEDGKKTEIDLTQIDQRKEREAHATGRENNS